MSKSISKSMRQPILETTEALVGLVNGAAIAKFLATIAGALAGYFLPSEDVKKLALCTFATIIFDTVTGMLAATREGDPIESRKFGRVVAKLIAYPIAVMMATMVVDIIPGANGLSPAAATAALMLIFATEAISVIENLDRLGIPLPQFLRDAVAKYRKKDTTEE